MNEWCENDYDTSFKWLHRRKRHSDEQSGDEVALGEKSKVEIFYIRTNEIKIQIMYLKQKTKQAYSIIADRFSVFIELSNTQPTVI